MKKISQMLLKFFLIACICIFSLPITPFTANAADGDTVILYTANLRGNIDVLPQIAQLKAQYEESASKVILVDAGNYLQGTVYATYDSGKSVIGLMDTVGYDVLTIGTYDFAFGTGTIGVAEHEILEQNGTLAQFLKDENASFAAVCANFMSVTKETVNNEVTYQGTVVNAYDPNTVITLPNGKTLGFFGLSDPNAVNKIVGSTFNPIQTVKDPPTGTAVTTTVTATNYTFTDPVAAAAAQKADISADVKVALSNVGNLSAGTADVVIDVSSDTGLTVGKIVLNSSGQVTSSDTVSLSGVSQKENIKTAVDTYKTTVNTAYPVVSKSNVTLNGAEAAVRGGETNLGDFWADALLWFAKEGGIDNPDYYNEDDIEAENVGVSVDADHIVAVWNGGNLRDYINTGDVVPKDLARVLPYPNTVSIIYLTGSQLVELLESASQALPWSTETNSANAAFLQAAGFKYTVAAYKDYDKGEAYGANWFKAKSLNRVTVTEVNGKAFSKDAVYAVIASNAIYNGMDSNYICADKDASRSTITTAKVTDVVWNYLTQKLDRVIGTQYAQPQGRINVQLSASSDGGSNNTNNNNGGNNNNDILNSEADIGEISKTGDTGNAILYLTLLSLSVFVFIPALKKKTRS